MTEPAKKRSRWAWRLGSVRGIDIYVHATFAALVVYFAAGPLLQGESALVAARAAAFVILVFGCVVLHELGHSLVALRYGIPVRDITLYPIGGVARFVRMPEDPRQELVVALAGPAVNVVLALVLGGVLLLAGAWLPAARLDMMDGPIIQRLALVNVALAVFNLLPAFPMDGGRVLRALLASRMGRVRATDVAAALGRVAAVGFAILALGGSPILLLIALFVWVAGAQEASMVHAQAATKGSPAAAAMETLFRVLPAHASLTDAEQALLAGQQVDFPIVDPGGRVVGLLRRDDLVKAVANESPLTRVADVMLRDVATVQARDDLSGLFERLGESGQNTFPVLEGQRLVGLLTLQNLSEYLALHEARTARQST